MNSLSGIRAINNGNKPVAAERYQRQYKGNQWAVFDAHTGGWGKKDDDVNVIDARVDELNAAHRANNRTLIPTEPVVAQALDLNESLRRNA